MGPSTPAITACPPGLLERLACPRCRSPLEAARDSVRCASCNITFERDRGVFVLLPGDVPPAAAGSPAANATEAEGALAYEATRFSSVRGKRRDAFEQSVVETFLRGRARGSWILDVPCGMGRFNPMVGRSGARVISVDLGRERAAYALKRSDHPSDAAIQGDALALPLKDDAVDAAICVRLTHHLDEAAVLRLLAELGRVAREVLVSFYNAGSVRGMWRRLKKRAVGKRPLASFGTGGLAELAGRAGLGVAERHPRGGFLDHPMQFAVLRRKP